MITEQRNNTNIMKNRVFSLIFAALAAGVFASCEKVIEFDGEITEPYLVLISHPEADSTWTMKVSQSRFFLSNANIPEINNAQVEVSIIGKAANSLATYEGDGIYNTSLVPQPGDSLTIRVNAPNRNEITAACRIPQRPTVSDFRIEYDTTVYEYTWTDYYTDSTYVERDINGSLNLHFKIHDPAGEHNYYMLRLATFVGEWSYRYIDVEDNVLFDIDATNEVFDFEDDVPNAGTYVLFTDERINGKTHPTNVSIYIGSISNNSNIHDTNGFATFPCRLEISAISRDLYLYLKTKKAANNQDEFTQILSEPVQVHTNINGGIGILGASSKSVINF